MIVRAKTAPDVWCRHPACVRSCANPFSHALARSCVNPFAHALARSCVYPFSHALGNINDVLGQTTDYYFDGANELAEYRGSGDGDRMRYTVPLDAPPSRDAGRAAVRPADFVRRGVSRVHGVAYIDEHLMMMVDKAGTSNDRPYYYVQDRLYNVWAMIDRAGAIVEGWCGHSARRRPDAWYGHLARFPCIASALPLIRESARRGDLPWTRGLARSARDRAAIRGLRPPPRVQGMDNDTLIDADPGTDKTRMLDARDGVIWDPRADMDDDGDVDDDDVLLWSDADNVWPESEPTVAQAFSDVGNPFMFQGVPHFALDTADDAESATLPLNHHRARFADPVTGRWGARDAIGYFDGMSLYEFVFSSPIHAADPSGSETVIVNGEKWQLFAGDSDTLYGPHYHTS